MATVRIAGLCGSLRKGSTNLGLLRAAAAKLPAGVEFSIIPINDLPLFNEDLESKDDAGALVFPEPVASFRQHIAAADALIFACPENNYSVAAPLKNAIDWASRAPNLFAGKAAGIVGSGGGTGTSRAQVDLRGIGVFLDLHFVNKPEVLVRRWSGEIFNESGDVVDPATEERVGQLVSAVTTLSRKLRSAL